MSGINNPVVIQSASIFNGPELSLAGNTTGTLTLISTGTAILAGGNNITLSQNGQSVTISGPNTVAQTNQAIAFSAESNTTAGTSTGTFDARSMFIQGMGGVSVGFSSSSIIISGGAGGAGGGVDVAIGGNSTSAGAGYVTITNSTALFAGGNNITLSQNGQSITISGPNTVAQTNQAIAFSAESNTTAGTSTGTFDARSMFIQGMGGVSVGFSSSSIIISGGAGGAGGVDVTLSGNTAGALALISSGTLALAGGNNITLSQNGQSVTISQQDPILSYYEFPGRGATATGNPAYGALFMQPFVVSAPISMYRAQILAVITTQLTTTMSFSGSISAAASTAGTGSWAQAGTLGLFSRVSTGTNANSSLIASFYSNTYSFGIGMSATVSWSSNVSTATVTVSTSAAMSFLSNIDSAGNTTSGSYGSGSSTSFQSNSNGVNTFSSSFALTFASQVYSGIRPIFVPFCTSLSPGEYWLGMQRSSFVGTTNINLSAVLQPSIGHLGFAFSASNYAELGSTQTINTSNVQWGWGSCGINQSNSTATSGIPLNTFLGPNPTQTWFNFMAATR